MNHVISWSGDESKKVATALKKWIRPVIQAVRPWMSEDIDKGSIWFGELTEKLGETAFGIVCLSRENIAAPWLLFEAGAVWKATERARVCTYLFDVKAEEVNSPLNAFLKILTRIMLGSAPDLLKSLSLCSVSSTRQSSLIKTKHWPVKTAVGK